MQHKVYATSTQADGRPRTKGAPKTKDEEFVVDFGLQEDHPEEDDVRQENKKEDNLQRDNNLKEDEDPVDLPNLSPRVLDNDKDDAESVDYFGHNDEFDDNYVATVMAMQYEFETTIMCMPPLHILDLPPSVTWQIKMLLQISYT